MLRTGPLNLSLSLSFGALQAWRLTSSIFHTHSSAGSLPSTWFIYLFFYIFTYFHVPCDSSVYFVCTTCFLSSVRPHPGAWNGSVTLCGPRSWNSSPPSSCTVHDETCNTRAHLIRARERRAMQMPCHGCRYPERGLPLLEYLAHGRRGHLFEPAPIMCGS